MNITHLRPEFSTPPRSRSHRFASVIIRVTQTLSDRYGSSVPAALVRRALNDAEELARETGFPHLFFPALAEEKVRGVSHFLAHDQATAALHALASAA